MKFPIKKLGLSYYRSENQKCWISLSGSATDLRLCFLNTKCSFSNDAAKFKGSEKFLYLEKKNQLLLYLPVFRIITTFTKMNRRAIILLFFSYLMVTHLFSPCCATQRVEEDHPSVYIKNYMYGI